MRKKALSILLALCMVLSLMPVAALATDQAPTCDKIKHSHTAVCYQSQLICDLEESEEHTHDENCYTMQGPTEQTKLSAYEKAVKLFLTLPGSDIITAETTGEEKETIRTQLDEAMAAYNGLTDEEKAQFDREYTDLHGAALSLQYEVTRKPLKLLPPPPLPKANANAQVDTFAKLQAAIAKAPNNGTAYVIEVTENFEITSCLMLNVKNTNITIRGDTPSRKLTREVQDCLFNVTSNASLTLENIVIDGNKKEFVYNSIIVVQYAANLTLNQGAVLQNNKAIKYGGAVYILGASTFSMSGATISGNEGRDSGGIFIGNDSTISSINIANSVISGNTATNSGGGLCRNDTDPFTLNITQGSKINDNTAAGHGGGIYSGANATVMMDGASQMNNNQSGTRFNGGGIYAGDNFTLNMSGESQINSNKSMGNGGGIYCNANATFSIKDDSQINENNADNDGGGIYNADSITKFKLDNSKICNNSASVDGGGIYAAAKGFPLSVTGSSKINANKATGGYGGGIAVVNKPFPQDTVVSFENNSQIIGNSAKYAGAFWLGSDTKTPAYTLNIKDTVTIQNNTASVHSGAMHIQGASVTVSTNVPISGNTNNAANKGASALQAVCSTLTLNDGVCVKQNTGGAAVWVTNNSIFTLNSGCTITENTSTYNGGGVYISTGSTIDMKSGSKITKNEVNKAGWTRFGGGGIYFSGAGGTIAGEISENTATDSGGGIYIHGNVASTQTNGQPKLYIKDGAKIQNNTASYAGGGIYANGPKTNEEADPRAVVYVEGGKITGNTAKGSWGFDNGGGGIAVARAQAEISSGTITGNTAKVGAGGVEANRQKVGDYTNVGSGKLTISGGDISGNTSGSTTDRTALNIQARYSGEIILTETLTNPQSLKVDASSTLTLENSSTITTQGNVTIGGKSKLITIDPNGGTVTGMTNFITGDNVTLPPASYLSGEEFVGWYDGEAFHNPGDTVPISKTVTYKAIWKIDGYTINFDANGGSVTPTSVATNSVCKLETLPTPARSGSYSFDGWYTSAADGSTKVTTSTVFTGNSTIYAHWIYDGGFPTTTTIDAGGMISPAGNVTVGRGESKSRRGETIK
ncbi:MAG: InlB B-repeat-containing protein [Anaerovoracaceae bacterium]